jgi:hypothetical protein
MKGLEPNDYKPTRTELIENQFNPWDGSHINLTRLIKESLNDPNSYEHVETVYWDNHTHIIVSTTFRGKNVFGGVVENYIKAKYDDKGKLIAILN